MKRADAERIASILVDLMAEQAEGLAGVEISGKKIAGIVAVMAKTPRFRGEEFSYEYSLVPADDNATGEIARLLKQGRKPIGLVKWQSRREADGPVSTKWDVYELSDFEWAPALLSDACKAAELLLAAPPN